MEKLFHYGKLTDQLLLTKRFPKSGNHTGGKWLIDATKHCKTISCKAYYSPVDDLEIKGPDGTCSITYSRRSSDRNILGGEPLQNQNYQVPESPLWIKRNGHGHKQPSHGHSYHDEIRRYWQLERVRITPMANWLKMYNNWVMAAVESTEGVRKYFHIQTFQMHLYES